MQNETEMDWLMTQLSRLIVAWKVVLIGGVTLTALAFILTIKGRPPAYSSQMILPLSASTRVAIDMKMIAKGISVRPADNKSQDFYLLTSTGVDPHATKATLDEALSQIIRASKPNGGARERIERKIAASKAAMVANAARLRQVDESSPNNQWQAAAAANLAAANLELEYRLIDLTSNLDGLRPDDVLLMPNEGMLIAQRSRIEVFAVSAFLGFAMSALFVLLWHGARQYFLPKLRKAVSQEISDRSSSNSSQEGLR